ncbi:hypothetical protein TWF696_002077 [Orbilia brochopaga]|uniref:Uncharacterized protein n=1 Tax=Orbilia brochopaga TaxID=3140254 RepID=A0AAV9UB66_9PEZI
MRSRSYLATVSIGAVLVILLSMRTGLYLQTEATEVRAKWQDLTTEEALERVRKESNFGYHYAAVDEAYDKDSFSWRDQEWLQNVWTASESDINRSRRVETIKRLYGLRGEGDWLDHVEDLDDEGLPPLTKAVQRYIYNHQHPKNCSEKQFILMRNFPNDENFGLGAAVFSVSMNLNMALRFDRVLLYDPEGGPGRHFIDPSSYDLCGKSMDCFFEPLTSCTVDDLTEENHIVLPAEKILPQDLMSTPASSAPPVFGVALQKLFPMMTPDAIKYWWRGQAASYIMRFNARTMAELRRKRMDESLQHSVRSDGETVKEGSEIPFPLPAGSVSMHVRHGDKGIEMKLKPFKDYLNAAERFISHNPLNYRKIAFISTENADVLDEAKKNVETEIAKYHVLEAKARTTSDWLWTWYWSTIPRANIGPEAQLETFGNRTDMTINWFLQLMMALECDLMIGTRASGWNRLLDNLRCGWLAKCQQPFIDVGDDEDWVFYGI